MLKFKHPSNILITGPTQSGKTQFLIRVLKENSIEPPPQKVFWCYKEWQGAYEEVKQLFPLAEFSDGLNPQKFEELDATVRNLIVIDDLMDQVKDSRDVANLFTRGGHHRNATIVLILQNIFPRGKDMRTVSLNAHYLVAFKNPRDQTQIRALIYQLEPTNPTWLLRAFESATSEPFGYMVFDSRPETPEHFRRRTKIFAGEDCEVFVKKGSIPPTHYKK